jgi:hypothetical protein
MTIWQRVADLWESNRILHALLPVLGYKSGQ